MPLAILFSFDLVSNMDGMIFNYPICYLMHQLIKDFLNFFMSKKYSLFSSTTLKAFMSLLPGLITYLDHFNILISNGLCF